LAGPVPAKQCVQRSPARALRIRAHPLVQGGAKAKASFEQNRAVPPLPIFPAASFLLSGAQQAQCRADRQPRDCRWSNASGPVPSSKGVPRGISACRRRDHEKCSPGRAQVPVNASYEPGGRLRRPNTKIPSFSSRVKNQPPTISYDRVPRSMGAPSSAPSGPSCVLSGHKQSHLRYTSSFPKPAVREKRCSCVERARWPSSISKKPRNTALAFVASARRLVRPSRSIARAPAPPIRISASS